MAIRRCWSTAPPGALSTAKGASAAPGCQSKTPPRCARIPARSPVGGPPPVVGQPAARLSTAFDSVTLYGRDPAERPDIYGKVGESGVSVPHLDDMKILYGGFDLCAPTTSVSMTINGPAPILLAMFFNTAIDQQVDAFVDERGTQPTDAQQAAIRARALQTVRGTVQADILKEDQGQNTCIFSTEFALKLMGDCQQFYIDNGIKNHYSVSISGSAVASLSAPALSNSKRGAVVVSPRALCSEVPHR